MAALLRTPEATQSLLEIWDRIAQDNVSAADKLLRRIDDTCQRLARNPGMGEACPDLAPKVRCFPVGNYVVFYRPLDHGIEVLLVTHGARDIPALFRRLFGDQGE